VAGETERLGKKSVLVLLCPPQFPHVQIRDRSRAVAVESRGLTEIWDRSFGLMKELRIYIYMYMVFAVVIRSYLYQRFPNSI
jgi:hypothetical protein